MSRTRPLPAAPETSRGPAPGAVDPVAARIRARRLSLGWSLKRLSAAAGGLAPSFLFNIEIGRKVPSEDVAGRIAAALGDAEHDATYRAWARAKSRGRAGRLDHDALAAAWEQLRGGFAEPAARADGAAPEAARLSVPVLAGAVDPGDAVRPPAEHVANTLRIDPATFGARAAAAREALAALRRPFAMPLDAEQAGRAPGLLAGLLAIVSRGPADADSLRAHEAWVVRADGRLEVVSGAALRGESPPPAPLAALRPAALRERAIGRVALLWPSL